MEVNNVQTVDRHPCWSLYSRVYIDVDGNVYPCTIGNDSYRTASNMSLGNVNENSLKEIFNSRDAKQMRHRVENCTLAFPECQNCTLWELFPNNFDLINGQWELREEIKTRRRKLDRSD